ncbi:hypothetical protein Prudu_012459 [Prunus dulcis]|uniref:Uncharacterized protein n=1 Tax=Prunus dulcis TaxID=3755 RepID=A0A4Y1RCR0_PRUDU|nr:hypothetical protein Prudu_012459 [Prunus dulcis]
MSDMMVKGRKTYEKSSTSMHLEELDDPEKFAEEGGKVITGQEYVSRLHELKAELTRAWHADDRVARLLMDTSVLQCYPTLFALATDILDMLGDMVWERIKLKAEFDEDETKFCFLPEAILLKSFCLTLFLEYVEDAMYHRCPGELANLSASLPYLHYWLSFDWFTAENFSASDVCSDAKETCNNWFCKIGAVRELLPRIYLELALLPCWRFLVDQPLDSLRRLVMMTRGLADPLASAYCRLYMSHCMRKLPSHYTGCLLTCANDFKIVLMRVISAEETSHGNLSDNKRLLVGLMEPTIEFIMKCIFKNMSEQLPSEVVSSRAVEILRLIELSNDDSFDQCLNYRLLGFRLCERSQIDTANAVVDKAIQVIVQYDGLDEYLKVADAYVDIILQNHMDDHLNSILEGISKRACSEEIADDEMATLQSILVKLLSYYKDLEDIFSMNHFLKILDLMHGSSRSIVNMHILDIGIRNGCICDPRTIQFLLEISQALHQDENFGNLKDDTNQPARLISQFVSLVDYGAEMESQLAFLVECRGYFGGIRGLKETLIHSSNCLAIKALKDGNRHLGFVKSCIAFSEVTLPSISPQIRQLNLYLETAEVALLGGLISHSDGLIDSAINSLQILDVLDGSRTPIDADGVLSSIQKLFSLLVMVPGNLEHGVTMTPRMRVKFLCAIVSLLAALSQQNLPYHADNGKLLGNDELFFGDPSYLHELASLCQFVLQNLVDAIQQEPSMTARGSMALEACNCIASSLIFAVSSLGLANIYLNSLTVAL